MTRRLEGVVAIISSVALAEVASVQRRLRLPVDVAARLEGKYVEPVSSEDGLTGGAMHAQLRAQGLNVSLVDAIQLATARRLGIKFLTRDRAFPNDPDVEFV